MRKTLKIGAIVFCVALIMACLFAFQVHASENDGEDGEIVTLGLDEGEFFDFYHQTRENDEDATKTDHRIICIVDLDWLYEVPMAEVKIEFSNEDGSIQKTFSVEPKAVYRNIVANVDGKTITYSAEEGLVIFGWIFRGVPNGVAPKNARVKNGSEGLEYTYDEASESYIVSGIGTCTDTDMVIPNTYEGKPVTSIGDRAFYVCESLTSITIPDSVTSIERNAFAWCWNLSSIKIPDSVTSIGDAAFLGCHSLESIKVPEGVTSIGEGVFQYCTSLTGITVDSNNTAYYSENNCLIEKESKTLILGCQNSVIPKEVTSIGWDAFYGCGSLTSIVIPEGVTSIGRGAFAWCESLTSVTVDSNNTVYYSENNCLIETESQALILGCQNSLIPDSVTSIGDFAFSGCVGLESITIPDSVTSIGNFAFHSCTSLTSIEIPSSVTSIGFAAFDGCTSLISITIPDSVTSIGEQAFYGTAYYKNSSNWADGILYINRHLIAASSSITSCDIRSDTLTIGFAAFNGCTSLTSIVIPDSVTSIGSWAFENCTSLTDIYCEAESQPADWDSWWNDGCSATVHWGGTWEYVDGVPTLK